MNPSDALRRVHPRTLALIFISQLASWIRPILFVVVLNFVSSGSRRQLDDFTWIGFAWIGVAVVGAAFSYWFQHFGFEGNAFVHRVKTPFGSSEKVIPLDRVAEVEWEAPVLHRMLGLVKVKLDTGAASGGDELELDALTLPDAEALRHEIFARRGIAMPVDAPVEAAAPLFQATWRHLILAGISTNRWLAVVGVGLALFQETGRLQANSVPEVERSVRSLGGFGSPWLWVLAFLGLLLVGWIVGIISTVNKLYGFVLERQGDRLIRRAGLTTKSQQSTVLRRIHALEIRQTFARRLLGLAEIRLGLVAAESKKEEDSTSHLCPIIEREAVPRLVRVVFPTIAWGQLGWGRPAVGMVWYFARAWIGILVPIWLLGLLWVPFVGLWHGLFAAFMLLNEASAWMQARFHSWSGDDEHLVVRSGGFMQKTDLVLREEWQALSLNQTWFQRRRRLVNLTWHSASTGSGATVVMHGMAQTEANTKIREAMELSSFAE